MRGTFCGRTRREFLWQVGGGFGAVALTGLLSRDGFLERSASASDGPSGFVNPLAPKLPHFEGPAKSVIFLFMYGGPSHVDTFDYKPQLYQLDGKTVEVKTKGRGGERNQGRIVGASTASRASGFRSCSRTSANASMISPFSSR
jgi:hypothetical protein